MNIGQLMQVLGGVAASPNILDSLFGSTTTSNTSGSSRFDMSQLPAFNQALQGTDAQSAQLSALIRALSGDRQAALDQGYGQQLAAMQGMGNQAVSDINRRYDSAQGGVGQSLASRGLYNSTVAPGMSALVERERNAALGQEGARQQQMLSGVLGSRTAAMDNALASRNQSLIGLGEQDYQLRSLIPSAIARSTVNTQQQTNKKKGFFSKLF